jgi:hypothetical protein
MLNFKKRYGWLEMAGRPLKLNDEITERICSNLRLGLPYLLACKSSGICYDTFNEWVKKGKLGEEEIYVNFLEKVELAETDCAKECMKSIKAYSLETWAAAAWLLERRYPREFGKQERIDVDSKQSGEIKTVLTQADCGED